ncbi:MAG TPA: hypothetical protein VG297_06470 [Bryobacteraceae bacterium]|jgi:hypothetical protein|nr:hypothetical protein [Bryobacteraceae bacterium]
MPILFIHGVNTRKSDEDYFRTMAARKKMFEQYVVPVAQKKHPAFRVADDVYWGDLGVDFRWGFESIPESGLQSLGASDQGAPRQNDDLVALLATSDAKPSDVQSLGSADSPAVGELAARRPGDLVRAVYSPPALSYEPVVPNPKPDLDAAAQKKATQEGEELGLMMIAAENVARNAEKDATILDPPPGKTVLDQIQALTAIELQKVEPAPPPAADIDVQGLGTNIFKRSYDWANKRMGAMVAAAKATATSLVNTGQRGASLLALQAKRDDVSRKGLRFLGDVFEYLHRGRAANDSIIVRVVDAVKSAAFAGEPLVVVTHSFGSEILYDALTSGRLEDLKIDLWVTAGAQTSLFGEMALFEKSDKSVKAPKVLGRPGQVTRWINFWDAADILSYLHAPIFGKDAVTDYTVRDGANLGNAHGHYFLTVAFYETIAQELGTLLNPAPIKAPINRTAINTAAQKP